MTPASDTVLDTFAYVRGTFHIQVYFINLFYLFSPQIIPVLHVLVFPQIRGDFSDLGVELYIPVLLLTEHNRVLQVKISVLTLHRQNENVDVRLRKFAIVTLVSIRVHKH